MVERKGKSENKAELRVQVLCLRQKGHSYRMIARELGIGKTTVAKYLWEALAELKDIESKLVGYLRQLELSRLDYMLTMLESGLDAGTPKAIETALKIGERRCKLLGLDAPEKVEQAGAIKLLVE